MSSLGIKEAHKWRGIQECTKHQVEWEREARETDIINIFLAEILLVLYIQWSKLLILKTYMHYLMYQMKQKCSEAFFIHPLCGLREGI